MFNKRNMLDDYLDSRRFRKRDYRKLKYRENIIIKLTLKGDTIKKGSGEFSKNNPIGRKRKKTN